MIEFLAGLLALAFWLWFLALIGSITLYIVWKIVEWIAFGGPVTNRTHSDT